MKIIYIINSLPNLAGTERVLIDKMNYLDNKGYNITLVTFEQGEHTIKFDLNPSIKHIDLDTRFFTLSKKNLAYKTYKYIYLRNKFYNELQQISNTIKPDIIISTTYSLKVIDLILNVKGKSKKIIESHTSYNYVKNAYDVKKNIFYPYVKYMNNNLINKLKNFDAFVTLTNNDSKEWNKHLKNITINNPLHEYPNSYNSGEKTYNRIICAGRLEEEKGFDSLIEAFHKISKLYPTWHIDIYGEGSMKLKLNNLINKYDLNSQIKIHKPIKTIYNEYLKSDFYVLSSYFEGFALVLIEAMSCGIPCVSFDCPYGPSEIIENNSNGLLAKKEDVTDLSKKIEWMITHKKERIAMGEKARITAKKYKIDTIMDKWENLFYNLINKD